MQQLLWLKVIRISLETGFHCVGFKFPFWSRRNILHTNEKTKGNSMKKQTCKYFLIIVIYACMTANFSFSQKAQAQEMFTRSMLLKQQTNSEIYRGFPRDSDNRSWQWSYNCELLLLLQNRVPIEDTSGLRRISDRYGAILGTPPPRLYEPYPREDWRDICIDDYFDLSALQKLEWVVKTNKTTYGLGEPVGFSVALRNISEETMTVMRTPLRPGFVLCSMQVKRIRNNETKEIYLTERGAGNYLAIESSDFPAYERIPGREVPLQPGEMARMLNPLRFKTLNMYYDLSQPGEYELTFYTRDFLADDEHQIGKYPKPCTVRFKIEGQTNWLDSHVVWPEDAK